MQAQLDAAGNKVRCKRVGIMYSVWHWPAVRGMDVQRAAGRVPVTVEDVIRSRQETTTGEPLQLSNRRWKAVVLA